MKKILFKERKVNNNLKIFDIVLVSSKKDKVLKYLGYFYYIGSDCFLFIPFAFLRKNINTGSIFTKKFQYLVF